MERRAGRERGVRGRRIKVEGRARSLRTPVPGGFVTFIWELGERGEGYVLW